MYVTINGQAELSCQSNAQSVRGMTGMEISIEANKIRKFLSKIKGKDVELVFSQDKLIATSNSSITMRGVLLEKAFNIYHNIGVGKIAGILIKDYLEFVDKFKRFKGLVYFEKKENRLKVFDKKNSIELEVPDIPTEFKYPTIEFDDSFHIPFSDIFSDYINDRKATLTITTEANKVLFLSEGKYTATNEYETECSGGIVIKFGRELADVFSSFEKDMTFYLKNNNPLMIKEENDEMELIAMIIPEIKE